MKSRASAGEPGAAAPPDETHNPLDKRRPKHIDSINHTYTEDHGRLHQLFQRFQSLKTTNRSEAKSVFNQFKSELERHIRWEEQILFPWFDHKYADLKFSPIPVLNREHDQILVYLDDIARKLARDDFDTKLAEDSIQMVIDMHNEQEEGEFFPALDKVLTEQERTHILDAMSKCK